MNQLVEEFFETMLIFFPDLSQEYTLHVQKYGGRLDTVLMEDIFMPEVIKLLENNKSNSELLKHIFEYFEKLSLLEDKYFLNFFMVTAMEILGNDKIILENAKQYMGPKTRQLQIEADRALGRISQ